MVLGGSGLGMFRAQILGTPFLSEARVDCKAWHPASGSEGFG